MKSLKQSCLRWTLLYVVLALLLSALVYVRFPQPKVALGCGFGGAILLWFSIGYVFGVSDKHAEARLVRRAAAGERPNDGEKIAVVGVVSSSMETLEAPMSRRRCVAFEYKAVPPQAEDFGAYEGFALVPLSIDGPRGSIRLLATPELAFDFEVFTRVEHYDNFREYIPQTQFTVQSPTEFRKAWAQLKSVLADDDGRIRYDIQRDTITDVTSMQLKEKILAPGDHVVAIGRYSATRNALVPDESALLHPVKITKGDPAAVAGKRKGCLELFLGCGCLLPLIAGALLGLALVPLDAIEQMFPGKDPSWAEVRVERWVKREVRPRLARMTSSSGEVSIILETGQARGKLASGTTTIRLTRAAAKRAGDAIEVTLTNDAGAGVIARVHADGKLDSLSIIGDGAIDTASAEVETLAAGESEVNGRITALSPGDGPKLRVMFRAALEPSP